MVRWCCFRWDRKLIRSWKIAGAQTTQTFVQCFIVISSCQGLASFVTSVNVIYSDFFSLLKAIALELIIEKQNATN